MKLASKLFLATLLTLSTQAFSETVAKIVTISPSNALFRTVTTLTLDSDGTLSRHILSSNPSSGVVKDEETLIGNLNPEVAVKIIAEHDVYTRDVTPNCPSEPDHVEFKIFIEGAEKLLVKGRSCTIAQKNFGPAIRFLDTMRNLQGLVD